MRVKKLASQILGMPDRITALSFDNAVMAVGVYIENKLQRRWDDGTPMYSLTEILHEDDEAYNRAQNQAMLDAISGKRSATF